ncbi:SUMF1/EgtB/PvdO family nonheme iron enzyme [Ideonella sp. 4Y16]|uniref:SUMF1/EgtB/PvdO family nonheme iron enzyme n=1 Tax=Ideonella alba TaxID=2824118 RepID=UPI001B3825F0|nr:SUMF1/EgtB/PvdO family nonheme iron enzyme [Ideonella alba]MBQ0942232.1 SUMF1/EgtB/PvdO family nonheme iron enzyme [Ideonella alba]
MSPEKALHLLYLNAEAHTEWHRSLVLRQGTQPPALLDVARLAATHADSAALDQLRLATNSLLHTFDGWTCDEAPAALALRAVVQVLWGQGVETAPPDDLFTPHPAVAAIRDEWLRQASRIHHTLDHHPALRWQAPLNLGAQAQCELPVLLSGAGPHQGVVASLRLRLVQQADAHLALVPAPTSALLPMTPLFADTLRAVTRALRATLLPPPAGSALPPLQHIAIAWDLAPANPQVDMPLVDGNSAGAAYAVGALKLLQDAAPAPWRQWLRQVSRSSLRRTTVTAALGSDWALCAVGQVDNKAGALLPLVRALAAMKGLPQRLYVAAEQTEYLLPLEEQAPEPVGQASMADLLQALADACAPLTDHQHALLQDLLAEASVPPQPSSRLEAVKTADAPTLQQALLRSWAQWEADNRVQATFVALAVRDNALGEDEPRIQGQDFNGLPQLLREFDPRGLHDAYVLTGPPGAGKTTLLRHHLQQLCRQALQDEDRGHTPAELPLLVPLAELPEEEADPVAWLRRRLRLEAAPEELQQLLDPQRPRAQLPQPRLLLDGLNELPMADPRQRPDRAADVVRAFRHALPAAPPLLLSVRPHHVGDMPGLRLLRVDVQPWGDDGIERYLQLRCAPDTGHRPGVWQEHLAALRAVPGAYALCSTPLNLAAYADLLEAGFTQPPGDRSALFAAWLWQRLRRALGLVPGHALVPAHEALLKTAGLLSSDDLDAIRHPSAWRSTRLRQLPLQGQLVSSLLQQAEDQWWADLDTGRPAHERGGVAVKWSQTALWLRDTRYPPHDARHDALRTAWGAAVSVLGLAVVDTVHDSFKFSHQAWGEWLASMRLLPGDPPPLPQPAGHWLQRAWHRLKPQPAPAPLHPHLQRLLAALERSRWPQPGTRRDVDELKHQERQADAGWQAVPPQVWQELLASGVEIDTDDLLRATVGLPAGADRQALLQRAQTLRAWWFERLIFEPIDGTTRWKVNLRRWGDNTQLRSVYGAQWANRPTAWQVLIHQQLWTPVEAACWAWLAQRLPQGTLARMQQELGGLALPPPGELDEVLGLALPAAAQPAAWLAWLLYHGHWQPLRAALPALVQQLEGPPARTWADPHPVLQHLRRQLLLTLSDTGRSARRPLRRAGLLTLLPQAIAGLPPALQAAWQRQWHGALRGQGVDLRLRWLAAELLGLLRDNLRYAWCSAAEPAAGPAGAWPARSGLRPVAPLWAGLGTPGGPPARYRIGSWLGFADEQPAWTLPLPHFQMARLPVTVAEWRCFVDGGGYASADAPWWVAAGPAAQGWLRRALAGQPVGQAYRPWALGDPRYNSPLQPMVGITLFEALAYAAWADAFYRAEQQAEREAGLTVLELRPPTELQWEAGVRGPRRPGQGWRTGPLHFNHGRSRCNGPTPVGLFSAAASATGLLDAAGNVWEWCSNALAADVRAQGWRGPGPRHSAGQAARLDDEDSFRALRGGAFRNSATLCRPSCRLRYHPDDRYGGIGVRLVREWPPHSEHWTPAAVAEPPGGTGAPPVA